MSPFRITRPLVALTACLAAGIGVFALVAWALGAWQVLTMGPSYAPITPTTALLFVALGSGIAVSAWRPRSEGARAYGIWAARLSIAATIASLVRTLLYPLPTTIIWSGTIPMPPVYEILGLLSPWTAAAVLMVAVALRYVAGGTRSSPRTRALAALMTGAGLVVSVVFLLGYLAGTPVLYGREGLPMAFLAAFGFLLLNAALLAWQLEAILLRDDAVAAAPEGHPRARGLDNLALVAVVAAAGGVVLFAGFYYLRKEQAAAKAFARQSLEAIAALKVAQIAQWRAERVNEVEVLFGSDLMTRDVAALARRPSDPALRQRAATWLEAVQQGKRYQTIRLLDPRGRTLLTLGAGTPSPIPPGSLDDARDGSKVTLASHHQTGGVASAHIDTIQVIAPLRSREAPAGLAGFVAVELNPHTDLFPMIRRWPLPSQSAEAYVVERHGDEVVILSELRFREEGAPTYHGPLENRRLTAAAAARGETGVIEGLDYRDVPVIAVGLPIAGTSWVLVAEMDQSEAYAEVVAEAWRAAVLVALILASLLLAGAFVWRHRQAEYLRQSLEAEHQSRSLAERLALVSQNANDVILLFDQDMRIVEANARVLAMYGRTPAEMTSLTALELRPAQDRADAELLFRKIFDGQATLFEAVHQRVDGSVFPVEVSSRPVTIMGKPHVLSVIRDVTERKAHEREIERLGRLYAAIAHVNQSVAQASNRETLLVDACRSLVEAGGFRTSWIGLPNHATGALDVAAHWGDTTGYVQQLHVSLTEMPRGRGPSGTAFREKRTVISNDFVNDPLALPWREAALGAGFAAAASLPILNDGEVTAILTVYAHEAGYFGSPEVALLEETARDVGFGLERLQREAAREAAEAERRVSDERLRLALAASRQGIYDVDMATGDGVVTPEYALMLGYDPATFRETSGALADRIHPADRERALGYFSQHAQEGESDYRVEFRLRTASGDYKWILSVGRIVEWTPDGRPSRMLGTHTDISERKQYEAEILAVRERLEATMNAIPDLLFELSRDGTYLSFHSPRTDLLAAPPDLFLGRKADEILPPDAAAATRQAMAEADARGRSSGHQFRLDLPGGASWFELSIAKASGTEEGDVRFVALSRDITDRKRAEEEIRHSLREKEALLKEVHHRVKNNLQVITSLLRLEASRSHESGTKIVLKDMQNRIRSMALLHETLYQTGNFAAVNLADYLRRLASQLFRAHSADPGQVRLVLDLEPVSLSIDNAIPCGLIVNELLTNSLKHAFAPKTDGEVRLRLRVTGEPRMIELETSDDGVGLPADFATRRSGSLGMQLVSDLTRQLRGDLETGPGPGTTFTIRFPPDETSRRTGPTDRPPAISAAPGSGAAPEPPRAPEPPPSSTN